MILITYSPYVWNYIRRISIYYQDNTAPLINNYTRNVSLYHTKVYMVYILLKIFLNTNVMTWKICVIEEVMHVEAPTTMAANQCFICYCYSGPSYLYRAVAPSWRWSKIVVNKKKWGKKVRETKQRSALENPDGEWYIEFTETYNCMSMVVLNKRDYTENHSICSRTSPS